MEKYSVEAILSAVDKGFSSTIDKINSKLGGIQKHAEGTRNSFKNTFVAMAAANVATSALQNVTSSLGTLKDEAIVASDAADKFKSTMQFAGFDNTSIENAANAAKKYADDTVYDMKTIYNTTAQLAANGIQDYTGLTQAAGNLNAVAGGNADTFKSVAMMLTQTAGAGKLTTENWNQLADAIPGASGLLQKAMKENGAYTGDFREAMSKGQITAEEFNQAIMQLGFSEAAKEAATSSKTIEGAVGQMQAAVVNGITALIEAIGKDNITNFINKITELVEKGFKKMIEYLPKVISFIKEWMPVISAVTGAIIGFKIAMSINGIISATTMALKNFKNAQKAATLAQAALNLVMNANPFVLIVTAIGALIGVLIYLWNTNEGFREAVINAWNKIKTTVIAIVTALKVWWENFKTSAVAIWTAIISAISTLWTNFKAKISAIWNGISEAIALVWNTLKETASTIWQGIVGAISAVLEPYIAIFSAIWNAIKDVVDKVFFAIKETVTVAINTVKEIITGVMQILSGDWEGGWETIKNALSTAWEEMKFIVEGFIEAISLIIESTWNTIKKTVSNILSNISSTVSDIWNRIYNTVSEAVNNIFNAASRAWENLKSATSDAIDSVFNFFNRLWDINLFDAGAAILRGFLDGLKSLWGEVQNFVGGIASWIRDNKGPISYDRKLLIPAGKAIMGGLNDSLMHSFKEVQSNVRSIAGALQSEFNVKTTHEFGNINYQQQPLYMTFTLGQRDYRAFISDITEAQNKAEKIRLKTV